MWRYRLSPCFAVEVSVKLTDVAETVYSDLIEPHVYRQDHTTWYISRMHIHDRVPDDCLLLYNAVAAFELGRVKYA